MSKNDRDVVIWKDINVPIVHKMWHIRHIGGRLRKSFIKDYGDVPVVRFNPETDAFEDVVNTRGRAYAARKRLMYRKKDVGTKRSQLSS